MRDRSDLCLAIDLGTGGPKVGYVRFSGEVLWWGHQHVETHLWPGGGASQDAAEWWQAVVDTARQGLKSGAVEPSRIAAVSCTGQWASTVPVDSTGEPVGECLLWMDCRGAPWSRAVIGGPFLGYAPLRAGDWVRRTGGAPSLVGADPVGHMLYLQHECPEVLERTAWFLEPVDYLAMRFTGQPVASHASMMAGWLTDNRRLDHLAYDPVLVRRSGVDASRLPPLVPTASVVGSVRPEIASLLGLPEGVAVVTGIPDLHAAACGAGAVGALEGHLAVSTSAWIGAPVVFKKTDVLHSVASLPGLGLGGAAPYLIANNQETAGACLAWLRDTVFPRCSYEEVLKEAATARPGAGSVLFTPWLNGERSPVDDRRARGGFHNLSIAATRADLARSVLEGVAFNIRWLSKTVDAFAGRPLDPLRMVGGGAQSELWCQVHADVMDRRIERVAQPLSAQLRGAAIFAGVVLGAISLEEVRSLVPVDGIFEPDPANRALYDELFSEFPRLYKAERGMFRRLN
ncbi:MAG: FGGY-family carbohydrate kinase [Actinomycetota bacterium]|nr:FGGY-family carbohydrate kinase [Actinomycetota bacterium]